MCVAGEIGQPNLEKKLDVILGNQSDLSMKMNIVTNILSDVIDNQKAIVQELQCSNKFLKEISKQS